MLMQYNSYRDSLSVENRQQFKELQTSDLRIEVEGFLIDVEDETDVAARIPYSVRRQAIDMRHLLGRSKEEIKLVEEEMRRGKCLRGLNNSPPTIIIHTPLVQFRC